jgi:hypothetical protein
VFQDVDAFRAVLDARWPIMLTPLDTCGIVRLEGDRYGELKQSDAVTPTEILQNYWHWCQALIHHA